MPSRRPSIPADAPLDVASATKPSPARMRAEPASQALPIRKAPGWACNAWKRLALSAWVAVMVRLLPRVWCVGAANRQAAGGAILRGRGLRVECDPTGLVDREVCGS